MNKYELNVNNATIICNGVSEYSAMKNIGIFQDVCNLINYVKTSEDSNMHDAWIYRVELNNKITLAYIKRIDQ